MEKLSISVGGMSCMHCEMAVQNVIMSLDGVKKAKASWKKKSVVIKYDPSQVKVEDFKTAITEAGYDVLV